MYPVIPTGQNKGIEMIHERRYNAVHVKGCSGGLNSFLNDCGCRKPSHMSWYKEKGQVKPITALTFSKNHGPVRTGRNGGLFPLINTTAQTAK